METIDFETLRASFLQEINAATTLKELDVLENKLFERKSDIVEKVTGYRYANQFPKERFSELRAKRAEIWDKLDTASELYMKKHEISPPSPRQFSNLDYATRIHG